MAFKPQIKKLDYYEPASEGGGIESISDDGVSTDVDNTDPQNPIVALSAEAQAGIALAYSALQSQTYAEFVYNSSGAQSGNRYNTWDDLITATTLQVGFKRITFEQNENISTGSAYNLDNVTLNGNGVPAVSGGLQLTFSNGTTISSWTNAVVDGGLLVINGNASAQIMTLSANFTITFLNGSGGFAGAKEFFNMTAGFLLIFLRSGSCLFSSAFGGYEFVNLASGTPSVFVSLGDSNSQIDNNLFRGSVGSVTTGYASSSADVGAASKTHANYSGTYVVSRLTDARNIKNTPAGSIAATTLQAAIDELDSEKVSKDTSDTYTVTNDTTDRSYDANSTTIDEIADVLGTLIQDLQDRSIIG